MQRPVKDRLSAAPAPTYGRMPIGRQIKILTAACLLPTLLLVVGVVALYARSQEAAYEQHLLASARSLGAAFDQNIAAMAATLKTLSDPDLLKEGDIEAFHRRARATAKRLGGDIALRHGERTIFDTSRPFAPTPEDGAIPSIRFTRTTLSDLEPDGATGRPVARLTLDTAGRTPYALSIVLQPKLLTDRLIQQDYPNGWRATVLDGQGRIVARNVDGEQFLGRPATPSFLASIEGKDEGVFATRTVDGLEALAAFTRRDGGWAVTVGVDRRLLDGPLIASLLQILLGGALLGAILWSFGSWWGRRLARSAQAQTAAAEAIGRGEPPPPIPQPSYREAEQLSAALRDASALLTLRCEERDAASRTLREQIVTMERRVAERTEELIDALSVATKASQAKSDFLANMSHELRTPLNAVIGFAQLLEAKFEDRREGRYASYIHQAGEQLHTLIDDILDLAKIESGQLKLAMAPTPLAPLFDQIAMTMAPMAENQSIALRFPEQAVEAAMADEARLRQVLQNLISNAIKYNRPGGGVTIDVTRPAARRLRIRVSDTGTGIPLERQDELFQAFNRLGVEHSQIEGTGIGLTICRHLADMMGGQIGFSSASGVGSMFWVDLAEADAAAAAAAVRPAPKATRIEPEGRQRTVLYVEDNPANLTLMIETFAAHPRLRLLTAETGEDGVALALARRPDVVLLDIRLPDISGYDVLARLRAHPETRDIPVIAISADALPNDVARGLAAGFLRYLTKPFIIEDLMKALTDALAPQLVE